MPPEVTFPEVPGPGHGRRGRGGGSRGDSVALGTRAGPTEGPRGGPGHRGVAAGTRLLGPAEGRGRGLVVCERRLRPCLRFPGGAQLPRAGGTVRGQPAGQPEYPLCARIPGLPGGALPAGCHAATAGHQAQPCAPGFGVACHLGILTDLPCIGVAKKLLQMQLLHAGGDSFPLMGESRTVLGMALRSHDRSTNPLYVSVGHKVSLQTAVRLTHSCCRFRIPEPVRQADIRSREHIRRTLGLPAAPEPAPKRSQKVHPKGNLEETLD
ncbi:endonuclease V isoform X4 [Erinaceus europaeus]|uniref:Endonuclease V isoform X4 n=1 Tax=Erinaceus europaeus TaxID=9365 RepID=A0ABM3VU00_ERIEU|nr:endonuclease V isoform X4 [Erinaceus europaeus]